MVLVGHKRLREEVLLAVKGIELAIEAAKKSGFKLKIAGEIAGFKKLDDIETLGRITEQEKANLMAGAKGFLALERSPDFGITPVESMLCGTPVIAFNGGGYRETVLNNKTGILFDDYSVDGLINTIERFEKLKWDRNLIIKHAKKFSKEIFVKKMKTICQSYQR